MDNRESEESGLVGKTFEFTSSAIMGFALGVTGQVANIPASSMLLSTYVYTSFFPKLIFITAPKHEKPNVSRAITETYAGIILGLGIGYMI